MSHWSLCGGLFVHDIETNMLFRNFSGVEKVVLIFRKIFAGLHYPACLLNVKLEWSNCLHGFAKLGTNSHFISKKCFWVLQFYWVQLLATTIRICWVLASNHEQNWFLVILKEVSFLKSLNSGRLISHMCTDISVCCWISLFFDLMLVSIKVSSALLQYFMIWYLLFDSLCHTNI